MELPEEDIPAEEIWHHPARLEEWFEAVKHRRESPGGHEEQIEDAPMVSNELVKDLIGEPSG